MNIVILLLFWWIERIIVIRSAWICESNKQIIKITGLVYLNVQARIL